jgi:hypothetical protein
MYLRNFGWLSQKIELVMIVIYSNLLGYRPGDRGIGVRFLARARGLSLLYRDQPVSGAHSLSYLMGFGRGGLFGDKAAKAWSLGYNTCIFTSIYPSVFMAWWLLNQRNNFTFTFHLFNKVLYHLGNLLHWTFLLLLTDESLRWELYCQRQARRLDSQNNC